MSQPRFIDVIKGSGAHPDPARAIIRAITEAIQSRLTYISGARDDVYPETFERPLHREILSYFNAKPRPGPPLKTTNTVPLNEMLDTVLAHLQRRSVGSVIVAPLTPPDFPFSVAKVLVPGVETRKGLASGGLGQGPYRSRRFRHEAYLRRTYTSGCNTPGSGWHRNPRTGHAPQYPRCRQ